MQIVFGKKIINSQKQARRAYSLLELSIVITIVSVLISGGLSVLTSSANNSKAQLTRERIAEVYKAMGVYLMNHKSLPCPAPINAIKSSDPTYGDATGTDGNCVTAGVATRGTGLVYGMVPTQDLNLASSFAEDGFGSKFTYVVAQAFTQPDTSTGFGVATETGLITMSDKINTTTTQVATDDAIFVLISHGVNKFGAYPNNSATQNGASTDAEEQINYGATKNFIVTSASSDIFDDIVFYKTRNDIVSDLDALDLILCAGTPNGDQTLSDGIAHTWPLTRYNQVAAANEDCATGYKVRNTRPLKRCGAFGAWESDVVNPCYSS